MTHHFLVIWAFSTMLAGGVPADREIPGHVDLHGPYKTLQLCKDARDDWFDRHPYDIGSLCHKVKK